MPTTRPTMPKAAKADDSFSKAQKRKLAGYKATLANEKSTEEAKANARKMIEQIEKDEKFETVGDRVRGRERNKAQEAKDEAFETIGDRVRARTELGTGLGDTKSPKRVVAGLKASLKNPHTGAERKAEIRDKLRELGEDVPDEEAEEADAEMKDDVAPAADEKEKEKEKPASKAAKKPESKAAAAAAKKPESKAATNKPASKKMPDSKTAPAAKEDGAEEKEKEKEKVDLTAEAV